MNDKYMGKYKETLIKYEILCEKALNWALDTSSQHPTLRKIYGSLVFTKICMHGIAIQKIIP